MYMNGQLPVEMLEPLLDYNLENVELIWWFLGVPSKDILRKPQTTRSWQKQTQQEIVGSIILEVL